MNLINLQRILKINTEEQPQVADCPFGIESKRGLDEILKIGEEMGFDVKNVDNYGGHIEWKAEESDGKIMGIFGHLDVVPAGDGWTYDPYGAELHDGYLYGRGTTDDKGPLMICLEAMNELKNEGFKPKHDVRLIIGCDEETSWKGVDKYFKSERRPDFGFTPDADFPIINGEKGILHLSLAKKFAKTQVQGLELRTITGGTAPNAVPMSARAVIRSKDGYDQVRAALDQYKASHEYKVNYKAIGKSFEITTTGVAAHGAKPEQGLNAISILMDILGLFNFVNDDHNDLIQFYNEHIGFEFDGEHLGIKMEDEASGSLTLNVGTIDLDSESGKFSLDIRYPVTKDSSEIYSIISNAVEKYNLGIITGKDEKPIYISKDNALIQDLLGIYREKTGDKAAESITIGGGTYARATPGIIAFGAHFPEDEDLMHQPDERISLNRIDEIFDIYKEAIKKLSVTDYEL